MQCADMQAVAMAAEIILHVDVLEPALQQVAVIRRQDVIDRILRHLALPPVPAEPTHPDTVGIDVTGEPLPDWVVGVDPEPPDPVERAPPRDWDCVDPPAPDG